MSETFYRKKGRRYIPVAEYDSELSHSFGEGHSLVYCKPGSNDIAFANPMQQCRALLMAFGKKETT